MKTDTIRLDDTDVATIRRGGLVIFPTETLYGLGCSANVEDAIRRVFEVKGRAPGQPPPVLIADAAQLYTLVAEVPERAQRLMDEYWPGSLTIVLPARPGVSPLLTSVTNGLAAIGVRCTGHAVARALCEQVGTPIVATSANYSGATGRAATPHVLADIPEELRTRVDVVIDGGEVAGQPSTVVDCSGGGAASVTARSSGVTQGLVKKSGAGILFQSLSLYGSLGPGSDSDWKRMPAPLFCTGSV